VRAASRSPAKLRIRFIPGLGVHMLSTFSARFVPGVFPDPVPMRVPMKKALRSGLFSDTLNRVP
jgi:hypothetical protein